MGACPYGAAVEMPAVGAVITNSDGQVLLVLRGHEPAMGRWSLPGGRVEAAEAPTAALVREVREETGLDVEVGPELGRVRIPVDAHSTYLVTDYRCHVLAGSLEAGDDAADVRWFTASGLSGIATTDGLADHLRTWLSAP